MQFSLTNSQQESFFKIEELIDNFVPRPNYVLAGGIGVGKSTLARYIADKLEGRFISFAEEYGQDFIEAVDFGDIDASDLLLYLNKNIVSKTKNNLIVIDGIEFILNKLYEQQKIDKFLMLYHRMTYSKNMILVISNTYLSSKHLNLSEIVEVKWKEEDKEFLSHVYNVPKAQSSNYSNGYYFK